MAEGTLVRWVKNEGENVNKGDVLAEIETDKATVEVESSASGVVRKLLVEAGSVVPIGDPIAIVGSADEKIDEVSTKVAEPKAEKKTDEQAGEEIKTEPEAKEESGKRKEDVVAQTQPTTAPPEQAAAPAHEGPVKASPLAKKIARDNSIDLARLQGTGPGGRVVRKDVEAASGGQPKRVRRQPLLQLSSLQGSDHPIDKLRQAIAPHG
jgi:pyruvate dehydrogenase E2 component (dihydrolipoamide acetyltransferase)